MQLKLVPAIGVDFYFMPEMREFFEHSVNDSTPIPENLSRALDRQRSQNTTLNTFGNSSGSSLSQSDTPSTSNVIPIFNR